ncbi:MAG: hypothetical protein WC756_19515 [Taibaiella sp.]|jgi:hypothetical protein
MKKGSLLFTILLATGISGIITAQQFVIASYEKRGKIEQDKLKTLFDAGKYDSAISYCAEARKKGTLNYDDLEKALATAYWYKGEKSTAYQYVINNTDYLLKTYAGANAFSSMLYDYEYAYPLATDSFLEKIIEGKVTDFYQKQKQDFHEAAIGLKFIMLDYRLQKLLAKYSYEIKHHAKDSIINKGQFTEERDQLIKDYLDMVKQNNKLLTWKETGAAYDCQYSFLRQANDSALHAQLKPYFEKAFQAKEIQPGVYVNNLMWEIGLLEKDSARLDAIHDSLCVIYKCESVQVTRYLQNGDSIIIRNQFR